MIVLKEDATSQTFKFIPRSYTATSMVILEEGTSVDETYSITPVRVDYSDNTDSEGTYLEVSKIVNLKEDRFYSLKVLNGSAVIYKDRIFCTNQTVSTYSINDGEYIDNTTNNEFIII